MAALVHFDVLPKKMRRAANTMALSAALCVTIAVAAGPFDHDDESASALEAFHDRIHDHDECYLVCFYSVAAEPSRYPAHAKRGWEQLRIDCTVVTRIKGTKEVSEQFHFERKVEGKAGDITKLQGKLFYVFLRKTDDGNMTVPYQDPTAMWPYSPERAGVAALHQAKNQKRAEQGGGAKR